MRVYNFSPGPSMLYDEVLEQISTDIGNWAGTGMSVMEMSHRSAPYEAVHNEFISLFKELTRLPANYSVLLVQGGASAQFAAVPLNLLQNGRADYMITGNFAKNAYKEAKRFGDIAVAASSEESVFTYIPKNPKFRDDIDYVHICSNNTIFGTRFATLPKTKAPIVCDMSSNILSEAMDYSKYGVVYAGAQKNIGPAGLTVVVVRNDLLDKAMPQCPTMLSWKVMAENNSLYNTPPTFSIFAAMLTLRHIKKLGGIAAVQKINERKAAALYKAIDNSAFYTNKVEKGDRSIMNIPFTTPNAELDEKFIKGAKAIGLVNLKGHRLVGGMRASIYNAMPEAGVNKLIEYMAKFEKENKK